MWARQAVLGRAGRHTPYVGRDGGRARGGGHPLCRSSTSRFGGRPTRPPITFFRFLMYLDERCLRIHYVVCVTPGSVAEEGFGLGGVLGASVVGDLAVFEDEPVV